MATKKNSSAWYIAATHYLTTNIMLVVLSFAVFFIIGFAIAFTAPSIQDSKMFDPIFQLVALGISLLILRWAVKYGAKYVNNHYVITDKNKIINFVTGYYVFFNGAFLVGRDLVNKESTTFDLIFYVLQFAVVGYFYRTWSIENIIQEDISAQSELVGQPVTETNVRDNEPHL